MFPAERDGESWGSIAAWAWGMRVGLDYFLKQNSPPPPDRSVGGTVGYFLRSGEHDVTAADWENYVAFARRKLVVIP